MGQRPPVLTDAIGRMIGFVCFSRASMYFRMCFGAVLPIAVRLVDAY